MSWVDEFDCRRVFVDEMSGFKLSKSCLGRSVVGRWEVSRWAITAPRKDTQHNDTKLYDTQHNDTKLYETQHNDT